MSSCQGELPETAFNVKAVDQAGSVLIDEPVTTLKNGFMELWLPRDRTINLTLEAQNRSASLSISTFADSDTCITTMQLK
jgi:hypothetical protein